MPSIQKKIQLIRGLFNGQFAKTGPFFVTWDIVGRCNLQCVGCPYHTPLKSHDPPSPDFPFEVFQRLCEELKDLDTCSLVFQGSGEPFLHPDLFRMIQTAKANGFEVIILTNGTLLSQEIAERLLESRPDTIKVSLWATSPSEFEQNYPGTPIHVFTRIIEGLNTLSDLKKINGASDPETILYFVINRNNYNSLNSAVDLALNTRCDGVYFSIMHDSSEKVDFLMLDEDQICRLGDDLAKIEKRLNHLHLTHNIDKLRFRYRIGEFVLNRIPCYVNWFHVRVRLDGHVFPCIRCAPEMDFGNVHTQSFREIWNGKASRAFRKLTMRRHAGSELTEACDCRYCCFVYDNMRVHRSFRFFRPFVQKT
jgi:radical SAM protein with 4Fe4S-binding SPASM domain